MPTPAIFDSAMAGLRTSQAGVLTTSQNVAGANVEGYVRRRPDTRISALSPASIELNGTAFAVEGFTRYYNSLLQTQLLSQKSQTSYTATLTEAVVTLDSILIDPNASVSSKLGELFNAAGSLSNDSTSVAYQQAFLGAANRASDRIRVLAGELANISKYASEGLANVLNEANSLVPQLAAINGRIKGGFTPGFSYASPDLLDERDRITQKLQELVGGQTILNEDGTANYYAGGLQLVDRDYANSFANGSGTKPVIATTDVSTLRLRVSSPNWTAPKLVPLVTDGKSQLIDGKAGAYVHLLQTFVPSMEKSVDLLAASLYRGVNQVRSERVQELPAGGGLLVDAIDVAARTIRANSNFVEGQNVYIGARLFINGVEQSVRVASISAPDEITLSGPISSSISGNAKISFVVPNLSEIAPVFGYQAAKSVDTVVHSNSASASNAGAVLTLATNIPSSIAFPDGSVRNSLIGLTVIKNGQSTGATVQAQSSGTSVTLSKVVPVASGDVLSFVSNGAPTVASIDRIFRREDGFGLTTWVDQRNLSTKQIRVGAVQDSSITGMTLFVNGVSSGRVVTGVSGSILTLDSDDLSALPAAPRINDRVEFYPASQIEALTDHAVDTSLKIVTLEKSLGVDIVNSRVEVLVGSKWLDAGRVLQSDGQVAFVKPTTSTSLSVGDGVRFVRDSSFDEILLKVDSSSGKFDRAVDIALTDRNLDAIRFQSVAQSTKAQFENLDAGAARQIEALRSAVSSSVSIVVTAAANTIATWQSSNEANQTLEKSLMDQKEAISGVNLDEEAANLVKYQQLYNASSKLLQAGRQMFDTLLSMLTVN